MVAVGDMINTVSGFLEPVFSRLESFLEATNLPDQIGNVDCAGLFANPWFLVPFVFWVGYLIYKQNFRSLIITAIILGVWWVFGTEYMHTLVIGDELQINKILPVLFGAAGIMGFIIYMLFGRS